MKLTMLIAAVCALFVSNVALAAIDCSRARSNVDKLICSSSKLGMAQEQMAYSFRQAVNRGVDPGLLRRSQQQWQDEVRNACNDVPCLLKAFDERGAELDNY
jgi:uncharacterized protein